MSDYELKYRFRNLREITPQLLRGLGLDAIGLDIDNTLAYDSTFTFVSGARELVQSLKEQNFPAIIVTNTFTMRASIIARRLGLPYIANANKPRPDSVLRAARRLKVAPGRFGMLGDLIFADVAAANRAGAVALLVDYARPEIILRKRFSGLREREREILNNREKVADYYVAEQGT